MTLFDARSLGDDAELRADVAVVGAGPAGMVTALTLADDGHDVLLLESGGTQFDEEIQRLGDTAGFDPHHAPMELATRRMVGGASGLWGGRCVPFDPVDFEPRDVAGGVRWPVTYEDLLPFLQPACDWCVCGSAEFSAENIPALESRSIVPGFADGDVRASDLERWSLPTRFGKQYMKALEQSSRVKLVTGLTCTEIACRERGRVDHLDARTIDGKTATVRATKYVIACGGLETTRLLFASNRLYPEGLGNHSGHLGRWYMAHVEARVAKVHFSTPPESTIYGYEQDPSGVYVRRRFTFSEAMQRDRRMPNAALWLVNPKLGDASHGSGILSFVYLMLRSPLGSSFVAEGIRRAHVEATGKASIRSHLWNVVRDLPRSIHFALAFGFARYVRRGRKVPGFFVPSRSNVYPILYHGEHLPSYDSHVEPSTEVDAMGLPRLETHLRFDDEDVTNVLRAHQELDRALRDQGVGRLEFSVDEGSDAVKQELFGGYHQAGTTRMSERPEDGVVDANLAVHGFGNLFIASSSTFVTSSQANSTLMIIVFALRLAEHLHRELIDDPAGAAVSA